MGIVPFGIFNTPIFLSSLGLFFLRPVCDIAVIGAITPDIAYRLFVYSLPVLFLFRLVCRIDVVRAGTAVIFLASNRSLHCIADGYSGGY